MISTYVLKSKQLSFQWNNYRRILVANFIVRNVPNYIFKNGRFESTPLPVFRLDSERSDISKTDRCLKNLDRIIWLYWSYERPNDANKRAKRPDFMSIYYDRWFDKSISARLRQNTIAWLRSRIVVRHCSSAAVIRYAYGGDDGVSVYIFFYASSGYYFSAGERLRNTRPVETDENTSRRSASINISQRRAR